jgi:hypothetical protein
MFKVYRKDEVLDGVYVEACRLMGWSSLTLFLRHS